MTSYQIVAWGNPLQSQNYPTPDPKGTEILVQIDYCGVCHTDLHVHEGFINMGGGRKKKLSDLGVKLPLTLGHEPVGTVVAVGADIDSPSAAAVPIGSKRVIWPWIGCRNCPACIRGEDILCEQGRYLGTRIDGGFSDHLIVPHPRYLQSYDGISPEVAAVYACAGITGYAALKRALNSYPSNYPTLGQINSKDTLLFIGAGGVGLSALRLARAMTDARIVVADISAEKRLLAESIGADKTIDAADIDAGRILKEQIGAGVAASIDFVGRAETTQIAIDSLRRGGTHVIVGLYGGALEIPIPDLIYKLVSLRGSHLGTLQDLRELIELRRTGQIESPPITLRSMTELNNVFGELKSGKVEGRIVVAP